MELRRQPFTNPTRNYEIEYLASQIEDAPFFRSIEDAPFFRSIEDAPFFRSIEDAPFFRRRVLINE
jgi:hypothetical protein